MVCCVRSAMGTGMRVCNWSQGRGRDRMAVCSAVDEVHQEMSE
jgi:hypothetical protein